MMSFTDGVAVYGAILATVIAIKDYLHNRSKINVRIAYGIDGIVISIQNPSAYDVHITSVSFLYPYGSVSFADYFEHLVKFKSISSTIGWCHSRLSNFDISDGCPLSIEPGKSHVIEVASNVIEDVFKDANSRALKVVVQDALWRNTYSSKFRYEF